MRRAMPFRCAGVVLATLVGTGSTCAGQSDATVHITFRAGAAHEGPPAVGRLCATWLPQRPEWPADLQVGAPFTLTIDHGTLRITPSTVALPAAALAVASWQFDGGPQALASCAADGTEDWFVPAGFQLPTPWQRRLAELQVDLLGQPRSLDAAVLSGHLAGPLVDGAPRAGLAQLGALCGEVTFVAWQADGHLRVRGCSDGGLLLPALVLASLDAGTGSPLSLRAFAARDGDRAEAARQLSRLGNDADATRVLRGLLHADDALRLAAIDTLVRRGATAELPRIVAAAAPGLPLATTAAADAVRALWLDATPEVRQRTREALARSNNADLRRLDPELLPRRVGGTAERPAADPGPRLRALVFLLLSGTCVYGIWLRERRRRRDAASA